MTSFLDKLNLRPQERRLVEAERGDPHSDRQMAPVVVLIEAELPGFRGGHILLCRRINRVQVRPELARRVQQLLRGFRSLNGPRSQERQALSARAVDS
jgi:hypothetical protein